MAERKEDITMTPTQYQLCEHLGVDPMDYARSRAEANDFDRCPVCNKTLGKCIVFHGLSTGTAKALVQGGVDSMEALFTRIRAGERLHRIPRIGAYRENEVLTWALASLLAEREGLDEE